MNHHDSTSPAWSITHVFLCTNAELLGILAQLCARVHIRPFHLFTMKVSLTFDNGPTAEITEHVLNCLSRARVRATFFTLGKSLRNASLRSLTVGAFAEGHRIGNHTFNHGVPFGMLENASEAVDEIALTDQLIGELRGPVPLFRPFGRAHVGAHLLNSDAWAYLEAHKYTCVLWNYIAHEAKEPDTWYKDAVRVCLAQPWTVIVMHDLPTGAMKKLDLFLSLLKDAGAEFSQDFPESCTPMKSGVPCGNWAHLMPERGMVAPAPPGYNR